MPIVNMKAYKTIFHRKLTCRSTKIHFAVTLSFSVCQSYSSLPQFQSINAIDTFLCLSFQPSVASLRIPDIKKPRLLSQTGPITFYGQLFFSFFSWFRCRCSRWSFFLRLSRSCLLLSRRNTSRLLSSTQVQWTLLRRSLDLTSQTTFRCTW